MISTQMWIAGLCIALIYNQIVLIMETNVGTHVTYIDGIRPLEIYIFHVA